MIFRFRKNNKSVLRPRQLDYINTSVGTTSMCAEPDIICNLLIGNKIEFQINFQGGFDYKVNISDFNHRFELSFERPRRSCRRVKEYGLFPRDSTRKITTTRTSSDIF